MGGDSAGVSGYDVRARADYKVFVNGGFLIGFTSSFRMGQLLRYALKPPARGHSVDLMAYMANSFIDAVRSTLKEGGFATTKDGGEQGGDFIVCHAGRIFTIHGDYQVAEVIEGYAAVGCGSPYALGALFDTERVAPKPRVLKALRAAEAFSAGVRSPFHIQSI
jgi:hypothetical protein